MWKEYSVGFIRENKASGFSVMAAAFISALFLSLVCSLFFNFWCYEMERIIGEEGDWQGRITGALDEEAISVIENFANVEKAELNEELSDHQNTVIDVYFLNIRTIYQDLPQIAERLGIEDGMLSYHELLLSRYLIHDPQDPEPPLLTAFYLVILVIVSLSLVLIIHHSFAVSMNARVHQFGIFSSIGATPGQIRTCLWQEAAALCLMPVLLGSLIGIALSFGTLQMINVLAAGISGRQEAAFVYHPLVLVITLLSAFLTVGISAWLPARKLSKLTPLAAIQSSGEWQLKKKKHSPLLSLLFGVEGELAGNALKAQRKALRTSTLSLTLSFLGFTLMLCFFTLSGISTNHTYFERYQNAWDVMATVKDTDIESVVSGVGEEIPEISGAESSVIYQKAEAVSLVPETGISDELKELGGLETVAGNVVRADEGFYYIPAALVVMDDRSFVEYGRQIGIEPDIMGSIVVNRIWDSVNSNFRYKEYIPFLSEESETAVLQKAGQAENTVTILVLGFTQEAPLLREEYDTNTLVYVMPFSVWNRIAEAIGNAESDTCIRILAEGEATLSDLNRLETELSEILEKEYSFEMENRIQERIDNDTALRGYMLIIGALCALLATIGLASVFSNTLGFIRQRKREFARYMSVGMTPEKMRKVFCLEALVIAGRPLLITLPITVLAVGFMIKASYLNPMEFLTNAPMVPILVFILTIFAFVALAYYVGGRKLMRCSLVEALRSDTMI